MLPYDVQIIGGLALHEGNIAEMKTGEGKTLVATFPAYLNALSGNTVHIVTVNDYLASRDAMEMSVLYNALGMDVGIITHSQTRGEKKENYKKDIIYATNNELGFDYLRDNMKAELNQIHQRFHNFAIVDEVDSILIDEARTPLIISGPAQDRSELYQTVDLLIPEILDEPLADQSVIPTFLVSKMAKKSVKAALSADGGDEVFAGYKGYRLGLERIKKLDKLPSFAESSTFHMS